MGSSSSSTKSVGNGILGNGSELTPMQKHSLFFDINKDGIIYPWETYQALRSIGAGFFLSAGAAIFINIFTSQKTRPGKWPSPLFPIEIANIKFGIHGSDTGAYDSEGMFVPSKFEEIFAKHAKTNPNYLTSAELNEMLRANRDPKDFRGKIGALGEWRVLYIVAKDDQGLLSKEKIRGAYDGSLFEQLAKEHASKKKSA